MKNYIANGHTLDYIVPEGESVTSGQMVKIGHLVAVAVKDAAEGETVALNVCGVYEVAKVAGAITQGQPLYYDESEDEVTTSSDNGANVLVGYAYAAAANLDATIYCYFHGKVDPAVSGNQVDNIAAEATADGSDAATTQALANALKAKLNTLLAELKEAGIMVADA